MNRLRLVQTRAAAWETDISISSLVTVLTVTSWVSVATRVALVNKPEDTFELRHYIALDTKQVISETRRSSQPISWLVLKKLNPTQQNQTFTRKRKILQHEINTQKLKPGLVASYDLWPGNGEGRILHFWGPHGAISLAQVSLKLDKFTEKHNSLFSYF